MNEVLLDRKRLEACIHCGLCLEACPTYLETGEEMSSPRGRLYLMKALEEGRITKNDPALAEHERSCLVCRSCETACPSGVEFSFLMEQTREILTQQHPNTFRKFIFTRLLGNRALTYIIQFALALSSRLRITSLLKKIFREARFKRLHTSLQLLPDTMSFPMARPAIHEAIGEKRSSIALLLGCIGNVFTPEVNDATILVLRRLGYEVHTMPELHCCGALAVHAGYGEHTKRLATNNIEMFRNSKIEYIITNIAGCGAMLKDYGSFLDTEKAISFSRSVFDISEFLAPYHSEDLQRILRGYDTPTRIGYQSPCHLLHGQRIASAPMDLLRLIPNADVFPFDENDICCGSAGSYNIEHPEMGELLRERKTAIIRESQPDIVATANAGCIMQFRAGLQGTIPVRHVIEIIAERLSR